MQVTYNFTYIRQILNYLNFKMGFRRDEMALVASYIRRQLPGGKGINLGHQEEEAHPAGGNRRICTAKISKAAKNEIHWTAVEKSLMAKFGH